MFLAFSKTDQELIDVLFKNIDNVNIMNDKCQTLLYLAACEDNLKIITFFISKNANINALDENSWTPLHIAACQGKINVVNLLLNEGAIFDQEGWMPLHFAAFEGHNDIVKRLLDEESKDVFTKNTFSASIKSESSGNKENDQILLDVAIGQSRNDKCKRLLKEENKIGDEKECAIFLQVSDMTHVKDNEGLTPLLYARMRDHKEVIQTLLDGGIMQDTKDNNDWIKRHDTAERSYKDYQRRLLEKVLKCNVENKKRFSEIDITIQCFTEDMLSFIRDQIAGVTTNDRYPSMSIVVRYNFPKSTTDMLKTFANGLNVLLIKSLS